MASTGIRRAGRTGEGMIAWVITSLSAALLTFTHCRVVIVDQLAPSLVLSAALIALNGCGRQVGSNGHRPPAVTVAAVEQQEVTKCDEFTGRTEAVKTVEIRLRVSRHIQEVRFQSDNWSRRATCSL
jgi:hypothetical protein